MSKPLKKNSLKENTLTGIGEFLYEEKFPRTPLLKEGLLELINLIADYYEEGQKLYPEIILVTDWDYFKSISNREIIINNAELAGGNFWQGAAIGLTVSALNHLAHGNDGDSDPKRKLIRTTSSSLEGHDSSLSLRGVTKGFLDKFGKFYRSNVSAGLKVNSSLSVRAEIMTYIYSDNTADLYIHLSVNLSNYNSSNLFINYSIDGGYNKILYSGISKYKYGNSSTEQTISSPNYTPSYKGIVSHVLKNINLGSIVSIYSTVANDSFLGYIGKSQVIFDFKVK